LVKDWRDRWNIGEFPFYYVQIAPFDYGVDKASDPGSALLREAQLKAAAVIPNSGMASIMDIGAKNSIHPAQKKEVGERLGFLALANTYGQKGVAYSGPVLKEMKVEGPVVKLS